MIVAAILVGLLVAYYLGLEKGGVAAAATAALFLCAAAFPQSKMVVYVIVGAGVAAVSLLGPSVQTEETRRGFAKWRKQGERLIRLFVSRTK